MDLESYLRNRAKELAELLQTAQNVEQTAKQRTLVLAAALGEARRAIQQITTADDE